MRFTLLLIMFSIFYGMVFNTAALAQDELQAVPVLDLIADPAVEADVSGLKFPEKIAKTELVGYVLDSEGKPLEGVLVDAWSWYKGNETKTDKNGFFRLKKLSGERKVEVRFSKANYSPHYVVQQPIGQPGLVIKLDQLTFIEGIVEGPDGNPVPNAEVQSEQGPNQADGVRIGHVRTTTKANKDGRYRLYVHPGVHEVKVSVPGVGVARYPDIQVDKTEAEQLDISLDEGVTFRAKVVDSVSGEPFKGLVLWHWQTKGMKGVSDENGMIEISGRLPGVQEFDFGFGTIKKRGQFKVFEKGPIGRWWSPQATTEWGRRRIEPDGWQRNFDSMSFELLPEMEPVEIIVEIGAQVTGHVYDPDGNPVEGATVAPAKTGSGNSITGDTRYSVKTKKDGSYTVVLPASHNFEYNLIAHDGTYQKWRNWAGDVSESFQTKPGQKIVNLDFKLHRPATIRGKISGSGDLAGKRVTATSKGMDDNRYYVPTTKTKADGSFELKFVRPGEIVVHVEFHPSVTLEVEEGETIEDVKIDFVPNR